MSLTRHLEDKSSPVHQFLRTQFPNTQPFLADARKQVRGADSILPDEDPSYPWGTIGTALDYRIRYYFAITPREELVAYRGARRLTNAADVKFRFEKLGTFAGEPLDRSRIVPVETGEIVTLFDRNTGKKIGLYMPKEDATVAFDQRTSHVEIIEAVQKAAEIRADGQLDEACLLREGYIDFFSSLDALTRGASPVGKRLPRAEEDELNRHCVVLALMEEVSRTGGQYGRLATGEFTTADSLIAIAESHWIDDLRELSWNFYDGFDHLLTLPHVLNPHFEGSRDVGGADADLIVGGTLIDIKTRKTTKKRSIDTDWLLQLLGYVLLDYSNRQSITRIGLYMARQGILISWDLEEAIQSLCSGRSSSIEELRGEFKEIAQSLSPRLSGSHGLIMRCK